MEMFVDDGNALLVSGLTGYYDEGETAQPLARFPLAGLLGAKMKEIRVAGFDRTDVSVDSYTLPAHMWNTTIVTDQAQVIGEKNHEILAVHHYRGGGVWWIPSPIGIGAWLYDSKPLSSYLQTLVSNFVNHLPMFTSPLENVTARWLVSDSTRWGIFCNRNEKAVTIQFLSQLQPATRIVYGHGLNEGIHSTVLIVPPQQTVVVEYDRRE
ncbi:MAG: hypothetical protein EHM72_07215 [Calditrichaeota bacterium]|nr:MAG: hypothetical protein EHM72_07215 [Calditrichota bacterium]